MLDILIKKIELLDNKETILDLVTSLYKIIEQTNLPSNDKIIVVDLLNAMVNNKMYK